MEKEECKNPWKTECKNTDIEVYIIGKDEKRLPICKECWTEIAKSDHEWGEEDKEEKQK